MKITPKQYTRVLGALIEKYPDDARTIADRFVFAIRRNRHSGLWRRVVRLYTQKKEQESGAETIDVSTARNFSGEEREEISGVLRGVRNTPNARVLWKEDRALEGGLRCRFGETGYDESVARRMRALREHLKRT